MGTTLKKCAELAIVFVLKRKQIAETVTSAEAEVDLKTLIQVIELQWQYEVSSQAANDLNINKWNKVTLVPLAGDLRLLKESLISKAKAAVAALTENKNNKDQYIILLETIYCRIILLNRRRPGELQRLSLDIYEKSDGKESNYEEFSQVISPTERILLKKFKRVVNRGKRGRGVPVLPVVLTYRNTKIALHYRENFFNKENLYLFGNPNSTETIWDYKTLSKYANSCGPKNRKAITSTRLRKHLATLTQIFSMSKNDLRVACSCYGSHHGRTQRQLSIT
ncbi:hypothetical protein NQ314_004103 [Rhamnusium bicolor]|uniref:Uncharacterized protein n=1 Tax=Rhamnusium bicolor TaxID=1586634 RepID=A0AAV8ZMT9_9CUCU|nr:hypothetical protein NQ314_004103 [Rhamnusium bicolor]